MMECEKYLSCPICFKNNNKSIITKGPTERSLLFENTFYDKNDVYHFHDPNVTITEYSCNYDHTFYKKYKNGCYVCDKKSQLEIYTLDSKKNKEIYKNCYVIIDSDSRFEDSNMWKKLPYDEYGWNRFWCSVANDKLYYNGKEVLKMKYIDQCYNGKDNYSFDEIETEMKEYHINKDCDWYYFYVSHEKLTKKDKNESDNYLEETILDFDGVKVSDAHIHLKIF